eukprot:CAMPEP_0171942082 /NCGR_PEP_ID=MMETSP0993-20121228/38380_1 /TAXON_ID=483369 /ORGANISM="non described non described, Strain CCMP2098" /LENGTH=99 /DNA_ID=CAMNT_0012584437 /DNA_START=237 /DNA_END=536 /DNA_ORIENTATION=+
MTLSATAAASASSSKDPLLVVLLFSAPLLPRLLPRRTHPDLPLSLQSLQPLPRGFKLRLLHAQQPNPPRVLPQVVRIKGLASAAFAFVHGFDHGRPKPP